MLEWWSAEKSINGPTLQYSIAPVAALIGVLLFAGCRTTAPLPQVNLNAPGWTVQHGQAVWKPNQNAPEIAGDLLIATKTSGMAVLQFTKTPFTIAVAHATADTWHIEFPPENKTFSGRGRPPQRLGWLHLAKTMQGIPPPAPWKFQMREDLNWRVENPKTGEIIEGFIDP